jgi:PAS domain S-box-containing protein
MLVDDEVIITSQLEKRLSKMGYEVVGRAYSGEEAVDMARRLRPDLILMDIVMPGKLDGIEAADIIGTELDIPVIFLTAYANDEYINRAKSVEPLGYIVKPFRDTELRAVVEVALYKEEMERKLRKSELRYHALFDNMCSGVAVYEAKEGGTDFIFNDFNKAAETIDSIKKDDLLGKSVLEVFPSVMEFGLFDVFQRVWNTGKPEHHHISFYKDERIAGWRENYVYKLPSGEIVAVYEDVTKRKQAEEALRESEKRYRMIFNSSNDAVFLHEPTTEGMPGKIRDASEIACQKFGYTREELLKLAYSDLTAPEQLEEAAKINEKLLTSGHSIFEITAVTKDGKKFPCEISAHLFEFNGQPTVLSLVRDIAERKRIEEELDAHREHIKLINKILRHDIINDLSVIHSALRLYGRSKKEALLEEISAHVNKSVELINRMRDLEIFISAHRGLKMYSVTEVLKKVLVSYPAIAVNIEGECQVLADESLDSVLDNIIRNAVVHGKTDRIDIKMGGRGEYCEIRIADYGVGIPEEVKAKIFEESFVFGETGGTGLGLYIVKKAMTNYGGHVRVEDNRPRGAVFVLTLKRVR